MRSAYVRFGDFESLPKEAQYFVYFLMIIFVISVCMLILFHMFKKPISRASVIRRATLLAVILFAMYMLTSGSYYLWNFLLPGVGFN